MKIRIADIRETGKDVAFVEEIVDVNRVLAEAEVVDYQFERAVEVAVGYYRAGDDLFFDARIVGAVSGTCARCLETYPFSMDHRVRFVMKPSSAREAADAQEDVALSYYEGDEVDLSPLLREAMILSLPTRPLCRDDCPGLCQQCGKNLKSGVCECREERIDPRLAVLRNLKIPSR